MLRHALAKSSATPAFHETPKQTMNTRKRHSLHSLIALGAALITLLPCAASAAPALEYESVRSFTTLVVREGADPLGWLVQSPDGVGWDGTGLWVAECTGTTFAKLDPNDGKLIETFSLPDQDQTEHLVWDGSFLWGVVHLKPGTGPHDHIPDGRLIKIDPTTKTIVKTIDLPFMDATTMSPMGLAYDGKYFYSMDVKNLDIYQIDPETGAGTDTPWMKTPTLDGKVVNNPCGISYDAKSGCFWIADLTLGKFVVMDPKSGEVPYVLDPPDNPDPTKYGNYRPGLKKLFTGSAHDGRRVWVVDEMEGNPLVWELDVTFPSSGPCAHSVTSGEACGATGTPCDPNIAACIGESGDARCEPLCGTGKPACAAGTSCQTSGGIDVCLTGDPSAAPSGGGGDGGGCACVTGARASVGGLAALLMLLAPLLAVLRRKSRRS
jgi:hypothetical protein